MRVLRAICVAGCVITVAGCLARSPRRPSVGGETAAPAQAAAGRPAPRRPALDRSTAATLADLLILWTARDAQASGDLDGVRAQATRLAAAYPDSVWAGDVYLLAGLAARRQGDLPESRRWLADALPRLDDTGPQWRRGMVELAETSARLGDDVTALRLARSLREKHPRGVADRRARRLTDRVLARRPELAGDSEQQLSEARLRLREGDAAWARTAADRLAAGDGDLASRALLVRAQAERALGHPAAAEATCKGVSKTANPMIASEALVLAARWRWNADDDAGAELLFERARRRAPDSRAGIEAAYALGRIAQERGAWQRAFHEYERAAESEDAALARAARWGTAWVPFLAGEWRRAADAFAVLAARRDADALAARYWQARSLERAADPAGSTLLQALAAEDPDTYYGWMASRRLGLPAAARPRIEAPERPPFPESLQSIHARRARALLDLGLPQLARREVDALRGSEDPEAVVQAYEAIGAPESAIRLAATLPATKRSRRHLYPLGYWDVVRANAEREGLDPLFVQALIRQESAFAARAVSPVDAQGLMQLMPSTASEVAVARGLPPPDRTRLTEVDTNVTLGTALLRRLLARYGGSEIKALAAYNAGEDAVRKWEGRYGDREDDEFVELISYRETKQYVKRVLENYQVYRTLYAPSAVASERGNPPNAPFDMITMTSPALADPTR